MDNYYGPYKKHPLQNAGWYLDRICEYRRTKDWDKLKELYKELRQLDLDFFCQMAKAEGGAYIYKDLPIPEAVCRIIGPDDIMFDEWPDLGLVACEGRCGWHIVSLATTIDIGAMQSEPGEGGPWT